MKGLGIQNYGYWLDKRILFSPSQFVMAWWGVLGGKELAQQVEKGFDHIPKDAPLTQAFADRIQKEKGRMATLDDITEAVKKRTGKAFLENSAIPEGGTLSPKLTLSMEVMNHKHDGTHHVTLDNLFLEHPSDIAWLSFKGGNTQYDAKNVHNMNHWGRGLPHERRFQRWLVDNDFSDQYKSDFHIVDYARACAMTAVAHLQRKKQLHKIKGGNFAAKLTSLLPFTFENNQAYAIESLLRMKGSAKMVREAIGQGTQTQGEVDLYLRDKKCTTSQFAQLYKAGIVTRGALPKREKSFQDYAWAMLQAWEIHFLRAGRQFSGYPIEFADVPHITIGFDVGDATDRNEPVERAYGQRIWFDDATQLPFVHYFSYHIADEDKGVGPWKGTVQDMIGKRWIDMDDRVPRQRINTLLPPSPEILEKASTISQLSHRGVGSRELQRRYK